MRTPKHIFLLLLVGSVEFLPAESAVEWEDVLSVTENIVCTCGCPTTLVSACSCHRAEEMNREVETLLTEGSTNREIYDHYVAQFGLEVLGAPRVEGFNIVGWFFPFLVLALGGGGVIVGYRYLKGDDGANVVTSTTSPINEKYHSEIQREIADLDT